MLSRQTQWLCSKFSHLTKKHKKKKIAKNSYDTTSANLYFCNFSLAILSHPRFFFPSLGYFFPLNNCFFPITSLLFLFLCNSCLILVYTESCKDNGSNFRPTLTCFSIQPPNVFTSRFIILQTKSN